MDAGQAAPSRAHPGETQIPFSQMRSPLQSVSLVQPPVLGAGGGGGGSAGAADGAGSAGGDATGSAAGGGAAVAAGCAGA